LIYCAKNFDVECVGMTISKCQLEYAKQKVKENGVESKVNLILLDYRDLTVDVYKQFDKITCFEMSEHVGIRNYQYFMA
jgi:cyclopropane fatty-acyl-phospholipid synthase-like methyltransferase